MTGPGGREAQGTESLGATMLLLARKDREIERLQRQLDHLNSRECRACGGVGVIDGFWLGTVKKCPACDGRGIRG